MNTHRLTRVGGGRALRTDSVEGNLKVLELGHSMVFTAEPLDPTAAYRQITTSPVVSIKGSWVATESGSVYEVVELEEEE